MLNYIWIILLFLGIGAALSTDIINKTENKYRNNIPISIILQSDSAFHKYPGKQTSAKIIITQNNYTKFYQENINRDLNIPSSLTYNDKNNYYKVHFLIDKNYPQKLIDIASASGDKNDISGSLIITKSLSDSSAEASMVLEEVSFLKMKEITSAAL